MWTPRPRAALLVLRATLESLESALPSRLPLAPLGPDTKLEGQDLHPSLLLLSRRNLSPLCLYSSGLGGEPVFILSTGSKVGWSQEWYLKVVRGSLQEEMRTVWLRGPWIGVHVGSGCFLPPVLGVSFSLGPSFSPGLKGCPLSMCLK